MRFGTSALAALALIAVAPAQAKTIAYQYVGPGCTYGCSDIGVAKGTPISLTLYLDSSDLHPNSYISQAAPVYKLKIGSYQNTDTVDGSLFAHLNSSMDTILPNLENVPNPGPIPGDPAYVFFTASYQKNPPGGLFGVADIGWGIEEVHCGSSSCTESWLAYGYDPTGSATFKKVASTPSLADIVRGAVVPQYDGNEMIATFTPNFGLSLEQAAAIGGYDHFNWMQIAEAYPGAALATLTDGCRNVRAPITAPFIDPIPGGMAGIPADGLLYYWDEAPQIGCSEDGYNIHDHDKSGSLYFSDIPGDSTLPPFRYMIFDTALVGVYADGSHGPALSTFRWKSDYRPLFDTGGVSQARNITPWPDGGTGGIVDVTLLDDPMDVPPEVKAAWIANGLQAADAPEPFTISLFAAGLLGIGLRRRRKLV